VSKYQGGPDYVYVTRASYEADVRSYFNATSDYDDFPGLREEVDRFLRHVQPGHLLEVGAGAGRDIRYFQSRSLDVVALDISHTLLIALDVDVLKVQGDARSLPFRSECFQTVWSSAVLLHLTQPDAERALQEFVRTLIPGGLLGVSVKLGRGEGFERRGEIRGPRWFTYYAHSQFCSMVIDAGLEIADEIVRQANGSTWLSIIAQRAKESQ
jgi:SAM-dependent methyltransferase